MSERVHCLIHGCPVEVAGFCEVHRAEWEASGEHRRAAAISLEKGGDFTAERLQVACSDFLNRRWRQMTTTRPSSIVLNWTQSMGWQARCDAAPGVTAFGPTVAAAADAFAKAMYAAGYLVPQIAPEEFVRATKQVRDREKKVQQPPAEESDL